MARNQIVIRAAAPAAASGSFTHPLVFPPLTWTRTSQSASTKGACKSWMAPARTCGHMADIPPRHFATYRTADGCHLHEQSWCDAGEMTVHNHGNHSSANNDGQPEICLSQLEDREPIRTKGLKVVGTSAVRSVLSRPPHGRYRSKRLDGSYWTLHCRRPCRSIDASLGEFDLPLVIADRQFDAKNQIPYVFNPNGVTGDNFWLTASISHTSTLAIVNIGSASWTRLTFAPIFLG